MCIIAETLQGILFLKFFFLFTYCFLLVPPLPARDQVSYHVWYMILLLKHVYRRWRITCRRRRAIPPPPTNHVDNYDVWSGLVVNSTLWHYSSTVFEKSNVKKHLAEIASVKLSDVRPSAFKTFLDKRYVIHGKSVRSLTEWVDRADKGNVEAIQHDVYSETTRGAYESTAFDIDKLHAEIIDRITGTPESESIVGRRLRVFVHNRATSGSRRETEFIPWAVYRLKKKKRPKSVVGTRIRQ